LGRLRLLLDVQATIDFSTGMLNAQGMLEPIQSAMARLGRTAESFAICIIDLPGLAGQPVDVRDAAMNDVGALLSVITRGLDRVGRLGDAAFLVVMPQMVEEAVDAVLSRLGNSVGAMPCETDDGLVDMEPTFTLLLNPTDPMEPESVLDAIAAARAGSLPGSPSIFRLGA
jgi:GGDEF domain-containing protein